jgi:hypothetical protein
MRKSSFLHLSGAKPLVVLPPPCHQANREKLDLQVCLNGEMPPK